MHTGLPDYSSAACGDLAPRGAAQTARARYLVQTDDAVEPWRVGLLRRAIGRLDFGAALRDIPVDDSDGLVRLEVEVPGRSRRAARRAERTFAEVWYDAFGERDAEHIGRFV